MTYFRTPYKFGVQTKNQIDSIPTSQLEIGDNVFNSDIDKEEFWTGNSWINDDCVEMTNTEGSAVVLGNVVWINSNITTSPTGSIALTDGNVAGEVDRTIGVIYRGGNNNTKVVVAGMGLYPVRVTVAQTASGVTRQHIMALSTTVGLAASAGAKTSGQGGLGVITKTFAANTIPGQLVNCWINSAETF